MEKSDLITKHSQKIQQIAMNVKEFAASDHHGEFFSLKKANESHMVPQANISRSNDKKINITALTDILEVDPEHKIGIAESGVTFSQLIQATMKYNLIPLCVSELKGITIGGAVAGCSCEFSK
jgi:hypothetical protein